MVFGNNRSRNPDKFDTGRIWLLSSPRDICGRKRKTRVFSNCRILFLRGWYIYEFEFGGLGGVNGGGD